MDPDNMYEEETVELNNESDVKEHNTDSEGDMHEVVVGEEEVIEHRLEEVVIFDNPQGQVSRPGTRTLPQVIKKEGVREVHKVGEQPRGQSVLQVNKGQIKISRPAQMLSPVTNPNALKRKAEASPMIVRLDNLKKPRPGESPIARTAQSKVRIVRHSTAQTDMTGDIMEQYQQIIEEDQQKIAVLEDQLRKLKYTPEMFENDDKRTEYFTGMETFVTMITLYNTCEADLPASSALTKFEIYIMTLLKLRLKLPIPFLGYMFGIGAKAVTYFYNECLGVLHTALREVFSETIEAVDVK